VGTISHAQMPGATTPACTTTPGSPAGAVRALTGDDRLREIAERARAFLGERRTFICEDARREAIREAAGLLRELVTAIDERAEQ